MNITKEFLNHLYRNLWKFIIEKQEFNTYWNEHAEPDYWPSDFYSDSIPNLIASLKENYPFYDTYIEVIGAIALEERQIIINFMNWFQIFKEKTGGDIYNEFHSRELDTRPLDKIAKFVETEITLDSKFIKSNQESKLDLINIVIEKFTSAAKSLLHRRKGKPTIEIHDEYDMQDILHVILKPHFPTIKIEEVVTGHSASNFLKIDFVLSNIKVAIECKCIRNKEHTKNITKELNDDIQTYHKHVDCSHLIFFIYDKDMLINDPDTLEDSYSKEQKFEDKEMKIELKIRPKN